MAKQKSRATLYGNSFAGNYVLGLFSVHVGINDGLVGVRQMQTADLQIFILADLHTCRLGDLQTCRPANF